MSRETIRLVLTISITANLALGGLAAWALLSLGGFHTRALQTREDVAAELEPQIYEEFRDTIERLEQEANDLAQAAATDGMHSLPGDIVGEMPASVFWTPQSSFSRDLWNQWLPVGQSPFTYSYNATTGASRFVCRLISSDDAGIYPLELLHIRFDDGRKAMSLVPPPVADAMTQLYGDGFNLDNSFVALGSVPGVSDVFVNVWINAQTPDGPRRFQYHAYAGGNDETVMFAIPYDDARDLALATSATISTGDDGAVLHPMSMRDLKSFLQAVSHKTIARAKLALPADRLVIER